MAVPLSLALTCCVQICCRYKAKDDAKVDDKGQKKTSDSDDDADDDTPVEGFLFKTLITRSPDHAERLRDLRDALLSSEGPPPPSPRMPWPRTS